MLYIFNIFLTIVHVQCEKNYDPTKSKHRRVMIFLEEVIRHYLQNDEVIRDLPEKLKIKEFSNLKLKEIRKNSVIIIDDNACLVYKVCIYETYPDKNGEALAKKIESDYICKIYDLIDTAIGITQTKQVLYMKIVAMELLYGYTCADIFYTHFKGKYIDYPKYNDEKLFYKEIYKPVIQRILQQLVKGVKEFHDRQIGMLDIKDSNLMYIKYNNNSKFYFRMIDLKTAIKFTNDPVYDGWYTKGYEAPEFHNARPLTISSDIWSIGMLGYYLTTGNLFLKEEKFFREEYQEFCANTHVYIDKICACDDLKSFLKSCLKHDPAERATAAELLNSNLLKDYNDEADDFFIML
ncbi:positive regulation of fibroblast apoptotic process [Conglomerata obtusa]